MLLSDRKTNLSEEHHDESTEQTRVVRSSSASLFESQQGQKAKDAGRIYSGYRIPPEICYSWRTRPDMSPRNHSRPAPLSTHELRLTRVTVRHVRSATQFAAVVRRAVCRACRDIERLPLQGASRRAGMLCEQPTPQSYGVPKKRLHKGDVPGVPDGGRTHSHS